MLASKTSGSSSGSPASSSKTRHGAFGAAAVRGGSSTAHQGKQLGQLRLHLAEVDIGCRTDSFSGHSARGGTAPPLRGPGRGPRYLLCLGVPAPRRLLVLPLAAARHVLGPPRAGVLSHARASQARSPRRVDTA